MPRQAYSVVSLSGQISRSEFRGGLQCKLLSEASASCDAFSAWEWLDGTHHQPLQASGFRRPTSYYGGYEYAGGVKSSMVATEGLCPTWRNSPVNLNVSQLYLYPPHLLKAPDISDANPVIANLKAWGLTATMKQVNDSNFNLGVTLGERAQTYRLVRDTVLDFRRFVVDLKRGRVSAITRRLKTTDPFKLYLQYRYGWRQLYSDIVELLQLIEKLGVQGKGDRLHAKTYFEVPFSSAGKSSQTYYASVNSTVSGVAFCKTRLDYQIQTPERFLLNQFGLDPAVVAWELLPWSFVLDWFVNVGSFLEAAAYVGGLDFLGGSQTVGIKFKEVSTVSGGTKWKVSTGNTKLFGFKFQRIPVYIATPRLALNPYALAGQFSSTRIADAVALVKTAISGSFKPPR